MRDRGGMSALYQPERLELGQDWEQGSEQSTDLEPAGHRASHQGIGMHEVVVAAAEPLPRDVAFAFEISNDALDGAFADTDADGEIAEADIGLIRDTEQDVGVVCEEVPFSHCVTDITPVAAGTTSDLDYVN